jgi:hypothetical protein
MKKELSKLSSFFFQSLLLQVLWMENNSSHNLTDLIGTHHQTAPMSTVAKMMARRQWR